MQLTLCCSSKHIKSSLFIGTEVISHIFTLVAGKFSDTEHNLTLTFTWFVMPPTDSTPSIDMEAFELSYSLMAYNRIPVSEYKSKNTGLTVVIAEVEGPVVNGFFCVGMDMNIISH